MNAPNLIHVSLTRHSPFRAVIADSPRRPVGPYSLFREPYYAEGTYPLPCAFSLAIFS